MLKNLAAAFCLTILAAQAQAVELGLRQTFGSFDYKGTDAWTVLPIGENLTLKPEYNQYSSSMISGTSKAMQARAAYDTNVYGLGGTVGVTPELDGYKNSFLGGDVRLSLSNASGGGFSAITTSGNGGGRKGAGLSRVDLGAGIQFTHHQDQFDQLHARRAAEFDALETDLSLNAGLKFLGMNLSGAWTTSSYNKNISSTDRLAQRLNLPGLNGTLQGFPDKSLALRADLPFLPLVSPFVTWDHTSYQTTAEITDILGLGTYVDLDMLELYGKIEFTRPIDAPPGQDQNSTNVTLGASLRFGVGA